MIRCVLSLALTLCAALPSSGASKADEILAKARKALGDVANLKSLSITGTKRVSIQTPDGPGSASREAEMHFLLPDKFYRAETMELPGGMAGPTLVDALDGDKSWNDTQNAPAGGNIFIMRRGPAGTSGTGPEAEAARTRMLRTQYVRNILLMTLIPPPGSDVKFEYTGEAETPDGKVWMIDAAGTDGFALRLFIDQKNSLPVMASWRGLQAQPMVRTVMRSGPPPEKQAGPPAVEGAKPREVEFELRLSDHAKQSGVLIPRLMTISAEGKLTEEFELKSVKINPNLKPEKFRK